MAEPAALATNPGVTSATRSLSESVSPLAPAPVTTTPVTVAVCPTSLRSTSLNVTGMVAVSRLVSICSLRSVCPIAPTTGASLVPVMVMVIDCSAVKLPSVAVTA